MSGLVAEINDKEFTRMVGDIAGRLEDQKKGLELAGAIAKESVRTNFAEGGRPDKWPEPKNRDGQPLRDTGRLMNSIGREVKGETVYVGTNVVYAAVHHYGAEKGEFGNFVVPVKAHTRTKGDKSYQVKAHSRNVALPWGDIPARPFLMLQDEDKTEIEGVLIDWIMEGKAQ